MEPELAVVVEPELAVVVEPELAVVVEPELAVVAEPALVAVVEPGPVAVVKPALAVAEPGLAVVELGPDVVEPEVAVVVEPGPAVASDLVVGTVVAAVGIVAVDKVEVVLGNWIAGNAHLAEEAEQPDGQRWVVGGYYYLASGRSEKKKFYGTNYQHKLTLHNIYS